MEEAPTPTEPSSRAFWTGLAVGAPVIALGIRGMLANADDTHPAELTSWLVGSAIVHDAVVLPVVLLIAVIARRIVPAWAWPPVRWALATSAILVVVSRPFVARWGYDPANPSALPRGYGGGVAVAIALVWAGAAAWAGAARWSRARGPEEPGSTQDGQPGGAST